MGKRRLAVRVAATAAQTVQCLYCVDTNTYTHTHCLSPRLDLPSDGSEDSDGSVEAVAPTYNDMWDTVVTARSKGAKAPSAAETSAVDEAVLECGGLPLATVARFKFFTFQADKMHVSSGQRETCDVLFCINSCHHV